MAISNRRLVDLDGRGVTFRYKDYRQREGLRVKTMTLAPEEFMRRFLLHVLPTGFHRIRHYGFLANAGRRENLARVRELLQVPAVPTVEADETPAPNCPPTFVCPHCGAPMVVVDMLPRSQMIRAPPPRQGVP